jgi:hypothetical protein
MTRKEVCVFSSLVSAEVYLVRSALTREGLNSWVQGDQRAPLAGEIPFDDARVELYVDPRDEERALDVIEIIRDPTGPDRACPNCNETNPPAFEVCWQCGTDLQTP